MLLLSCAKELRDELYSQSVLLTFCNLWGMWLIVTMGDLLTIVGAGYKTRWNYVPNTIFNLFTPILFGNLGGAAVKITLPLMFGVLWLGNLVGSKINSATLRIVYNLLVLFLLTFAVDYITWGGWISGVRVMEMLGFGRSAPLAR